METRSKMTLAAVTRGKVKRPQKIVLYGTEKIGKSTWAGDAPAPIFLPLEDGSHHLDVARFPRATSWGETLDALDALAGEHDYRTLVVDTLDALEPIVWARTCATKLNGEKRATAIEDYGFGKGYVYALDVWRDFLARLDVLVSRGMSVVLISHAALATIKNPDGEDYQRFDLKLHRAASALVCEWTDHLLFAAVDVGIAKIDRRTKVTSLGERVLHTAASPAWKAGTRSAAPPRLPLAWADWEQALEGASPEPILARIEEMKPHVPEAKRAAVEAAIEKAKASSDIVAALTTVANKIAATISKEAA
jgi:hypothetical protein